MGKQTTIQTPYSPQLAVQYLENIKYPENIYEGADQLVALCHAQAVSMYWWHEKDGTPKQLNFGERIALQHSELSEALEGFRRDLASDHIEGFSMVEEELADAIIRICDTAGGMSLRLGAALKAKLAYNMVRLDHKPEAREAEGGKAF
jgi:hypothetical protein